ncbi:unnamed protein product [Caenorhabditis bovis]|uniref:Uncharacterized protein n=1 Tax=Caenorhabditis bovis TaxID=2654633 RepID=A0A8S1FCP8_9PELO|nr:unnamed protein product [Caenorhabditis bovis]
MADVEQTSPEDVKNQTYYEKLMENPYVKQAINVYSKTKEIHPLVNSTLTAAEQKAFDSYNTLYVKPKENACEYLSYGQEKAKNAVETSKQAAILGGTYGIGAAVVLTQFSLALSAGGASMILDQVDNAKQIGAGTLSSLRQAQLAIEHRIMSAVHQAQRMAMVPIEKISENTNALLDILDAAIENALQVKVTNAPEATITQRVSNLASVIVQGLSQKAHNHVIDPVNDQVNILLEKLSKSFILVDVLRAQKQWVVDKVGEVSSTVSEYKKQIETEAAQYKVAPEEMLMKSIRSTSLQLSERLKSLREKGQNVFGDNNRIDSAIDYLEKLEKNFTDAENVYKVRDEVLNEARQRLTEFTTLASNLLVRPQTE